MAKHVQMRSVERSSRTGAPVSYGRPITFPPHVAKQMLMESPYSWEVIDEEFEVPDDTRKYVKKSRMGKVSDNVMQQLAAKHVVK